MIAPVAIVHALESPEKVVFLSGSGDTHEMDRHYHQCSRSLRPLFELNNNGLRKCPVGPSHEIHYTGLADTLNVDFKPEEIDEC